MSAAVLSVGPVVTVTQMLQERKVLNTGFPVTTTLAVDVSYQYFMCYTQLNHRNQYNP